VPDEYVGPCRDSYRSGDGGWLAIPIDAACHVCAYREGSSSPFGSPPACWGEVLDIAAHNGARVAMPLHGVHGLMALCTMLAQNGTPIVERQPWPDPDFTAWALELFRTLLRGAGSANMLGWNPIHALQSVVDGETDYLPLTFGYAYFQRSGVRFGLPPVLAAKDRGHGSILGGTGSALSPNSRCPELAEPLARFAASRQVQVNLWSQQGQPAHRSAWNDLAERDAFYRDTRAAMEHSYVRPRCRGWNHFQSAAGRAINRGLAEGLLARDIVATLGQLWENVNSEFK
jgi:multiple sugar transport system substrate-binding protein